MSFGGRRAARVGDARAWRLAVGARRRVIAGLLAALAVVLVVAELRPTEPLSGMLVVVAAVDLEGGVTVSPTDVRTVSLPADVVPVGVVRRLEDAVGHTLAAPIRRGEPITDVRFLGPGLITRRQASAGLVATPVRITDAGSVVFLRAGDRVDVLAASAEMTVPVPQTRDGATPTDGAEPAVGSSAVPMTGPARAAVVAPGVVVLAVPRPGAAKEGAAGMADGALVIVAATSRVAETLASAAVHARLSVTVLGRESAAG